jgi:hypothetical protein
VHRRRIKLAGQQVDRSLHAGDGRVGLVEARVQVLQPIIESVQAPGHTFEPAGHSLQPALERVEWSADPLAECGHRLDNPGEHGVLGVDTRQGLVQPLGDDADLSSVRQFGQPPLDRRDVVTSRQDAQPVLHLTYCGMGPNGCRWRDLGLCRRTPSQVPWGVSTRR